MIPHNFTDSPGHPKPNNQELVQGALILRSSGEVDMGKLGWKLWIPVCRLQRRTLCVAAGLAGLLVLVNSLAASVAASPKSSPQASHAASRDATTSDAARRDAIRSIPLAKLAAEDRAKVESVLSNVSVFRRMPVRVVDCDPDLYLFLVRHPDVVVNIWEVFKISRLTLRETDDHQFMVNEMDGATVSIEFLYQSHDTHLVYGEGVYRGSLLSRPVKGRGLLVLKTGYIRETNGRYYVTSRLDSFVSIEPAGAELVTKTISPVIGKTVDNNFVQTLAFLASLSRTAEVNSHGVQRLGEQLTHVQPKVREQFMELAAAIPQKQVEASRKTPRIASQPAEQPDR
jgi:hypothetical protein